jgi:hypothetical protein
MHCCLGDHGDATALTSNGVPEGPATRKIDMRSEREPSTTACSLQSPLDPAAKQRKPTTKSTGLKSSSATLPGRPGIHPAGFPATDSEAPSTGL